MNGAKKKKKEEEEREERGRTSPLTRSSAANSARWSAACRPSERPRGGCAAGPADSAEGSEGTAREGGGVRRKR